MQFSQFPKAENKQPLSTFPCPLSPIQSLFFPHLLNLPFLLFFPSATLVHTTQPASLCPLWPSLIHVPHSKYSQSWKNRNHIISVQGLRFSNSFSIILRTKLSFLRRPTYPFVRELQLPLQPWKTPSPYLPGCSQTGIPSGPTSHLTTFTYASPSVWDTFS